ncbi:hypothetical protein [Levilactobacillus yiduensis]|uniref:hypothetical protein n=1 Tax=Levilactobacillus yiduensis TaxID=2953880 RepID=UPI0021589F0E|nr:hypothetical protein [Levilactobacillus yiduensis]
MKTSEFTKFMKQTGYTVRMTGRGRLAIGSEIIPGTALIDVHQVGKYQIHDLPDYVANVVMDYAGTPLNERETEKRWNIILGQDVGGGSYFSAWYKRGSGFGITALVDENSLRMSDFIFTESEFLALIAQLKLLPNGDVYAKIAEFGKQEVKR